MKKIYSFIMICLCMVLCFSACSKPDSGKSGENSQNSIAKDKILRIGSRYALSSLDTHKDYRGWQTSTYGISETLFKVGEDFTLQPWIAESGNSDGLVWTIALKDNVCFSDGDLVTPEMVIRNLKRVAQENPRFEFLSEFAYEVIDGKSFTITTKEAYPTLLNVLSSCETGIINLDKTTDFDNTIIGTGPFILTEFEPDGTLKVSRNEKYWGGSVILDGAEFYHIPEEDALLLAMQNGEIDAYMNVNSAALEIFEKDQEMYKLVDIPSPRLQLCIFNQNTLSPEIRKAITLTIDNEKMITYLGKVMSVTYGPFNSTTAYGKVKRQEIDPNKANSLLEKEGYVKNSEGYFEKDGKKITVNIAFYPGRSLDVLATLIQEQLKQVGIDAVLKSFEGPDAYISTADFDVALLSMNADIYGDPEYFITNTLKNGAYYNVGGFKSEECESLIKELSSESDKTKRADLANKIIQIAIEDNAFGYLSLTNKITVLKPNVTGFAENSPFDFYGIDAKSDIK